MIIVADSGLLSNDNIDQLNLQGYKFILGARIRSETKQFKDEILSLGLQNSQSTVIKKDGIQRLVISYSERRAKKQKDRINREKVLSRLQEKVKSGTHICIAFVAYKIYKELERQLKDKKSALSPEKAIDIAKTIYSIKLETSANMEVIEKTTILSQGKKYLAQVFNF